MSPGYCGSGEVALLTHCFQEAVTASVHSLGGFRVITVADGRLALCAAAVSLWGFYPPQKNLSVSFLG